MSPMPPLTAFRIKYGVPMLNDPLQLAETEVRQLRYALQVISNHKVTIGQLEQTISTLRDEIIEIDG